MINIAICDDNFAVIEDVKKMIHQYEKNLADTFSISDFSLPSELFLSMQKNSVDIVFLDLEFHQPDYDGILWASRIHAQFPDCLILILTAYEERFREGYIARAFRFMTKPLIYQEFEQNMNACLNELKLHDSISIIQHGTELSIPLKNIIYFSAHFGGVEICTPGNTFYSHESLLQWEQQLEPNAFFRCHKKYLINLAHIHSLDDHMAEMSNLKQLPVSRRKWPLLQSAYIKYDLTKGLPH